MRRVLPAAALLLAAPPLLAQAPPAAPPSLPSPLAGGVRQVVEVRAVDLDVVATKDGRPVEDLTRDELAIKVDGKPFPIDYFARVSAGTLHGPDLQTASPDLVLETLQADSGERYLPREFLIFFDDAHLLPQYRAPVIEGLRDFVTRLSPSDRASIASYGTTTRVLVPFTSSKEDLLDGLDRLAKITPAGLRTETDFRIQVQDAQRARFYSVRAGIVRAWAGEARARERGTLEELRHAVAALGARAGKRVLLWVSAGLELHPGQSFAQAFGGSPFQQFEEDVTKDFRAVVAEANRVGVTIHAFDAKGLTADADASSSTPSPFSSFLVSQNLREPLADLARQTGGTLVENRNGFAPGLDRVYRESTTYYSVGVTLKNLDPRVKEHQVEVTTTRKGVELRTRRSVAPGTAAEAARDRMEMALMNPDAKGDFPATLKVGAPQKGRVLPYEVSVPFSVLTFREEKGKRVALLELSLAAVSDAGARSSISTMKLAVEAGPEPAQTWDFAGSLKSGKGNYRFVATVRDVATDRIGIASAAVRVE